MEWRQYEPAPCGSSVQEEPSKKLPVMGGGCCVVRDACGTSPSDSSMREPPVADLELIITETEKKGQAATSGAQHVQKAYNVGYKYKETKHSTKYREPFKHPEGNFPPAQGASAMG